MFDIFDRNMISVSSIQSTENGKKKVFEEMREKWHIHP